LLAEKAFSKIDIFEQRDSVGGIWNYTPEHNPQDDASFAVPQENPHQGVEKPVWRSRVKSSGTVNGDTNGTKTANGDSRDAEKKEPVFMTPMYDRLETNIPRSLMRFSDHPFNDSLQLFPKHDSVLDYLEDYAQDVRHLINFNTQVVDVRPLESSRPSTNGIPQENGHKAEPEHHPWTLTTRSIFTSQTQTHTYDAVAISSGHFSTPFIPSIRGIQSWAAAHPGAISHSKHYRTPAAFRGKKVVVVGNSASGLDIGGQIAQVCEGPLIMSVKSESYLAPGGKPAHSNIVEVSQIVEFLPENRALRFEDGRVECDVDAVVFCTGYLYSFPFLSSLSPPPITDGTRVEHTYKHLFYAPRPTMAFLALAQKIIPFPHAEAQAAVLARVWSGRLGLPEYDEMRRWEEGVVKERGGGGEFHTLHFPKDGEYINEMCDWAAEADGEAEGRGKLPKRWGQWEFWARERFPAIRRAFVERGEGRAGVRRLEEIGFDFERWQEERRREGKELL